MSTIIQGSLHFKHTIVNFTKIYPNAQQVLTKKSLKVWWKNLISPRQQYFCDDILTSTLTLDFLHTFGTCVGSNRRSLFWYQRFNWCSCAEVRSISRRWGAEVRSSIKRQGAEVGRRSRRWGLQRIKGKQWLLMPQWLRQSMQRNLSR